MNTKLKISIGLLMTFGLTFATTMLPLSIEELIDKSPLIITGEVVSIETYENQENGIIHREVAVIPNEVLKGEISPDIPIIVYVLGGTIGERAVFVPGSPEFEVGEKVLLFLMDHKDGKMWVRGLAQGKFTLIETPEGIKAVRDISDIYLVSRDGKEIDLKSTYNLNELRNLIISKRGH